MPQNLDFLKPHLGDDLFSQVTQRLSGVQGLMLANVGDGSYIPKSKYDEDVGAGKTQITSLTGQLAAAQQASVNNQQLQAQITKLTGDLAERDKTIANMQKASLVLADLRADGARNPDMLLRMLDLDKIEVKDGKINGLKEQTDPLKKSDPYLFSGLPPARGGVDGGNGGNGNNGGSGAPDLNQQVNAAIRSAAGRVTV